MARRSFGGKIAGNGGPVNHGDEMVVHFGLLLMERSSDGGVNYLNEPEKANFSYGKT